MSVSQFIFSFGFPLMIWAKKEQFNYRNKLMRKNSSIITHNRYRNFLGTNSGLEKLQNSSIITKKKKCSVLDSITDDNNQSEDCKKKTNKHKYFVNITKSTTKSTRMWSPTLGKQRRNLASSLVEAPFIHLWVIYFYLCRRENDERNG